MLNIQLHIQINGLPEFICFNILNLVFYMKLMTKNKQIKVDQQH